MSNNHFQTWTHDQMVAATTRQLDELEEATRRFRGALEGERYVELDTWGGTIREAGQELAEFAAQLMAGALNEALGGGPGSPPGLRVWRDGRWLLPSELEAGG